MFKRVTQRFTKKAKLDEEGTAAPVAAAAASGSKAKGKGKEEVVDDVGVDVVGSDDEDEDDDDDEDFEDEEDDSEEDDEEDEDLGPISGESDSSSDDDSDSDDEEDIKSVKKNKNGKRPAPGDFDDEEDEEEEEDDDDDDDDPPPISLAECLTASPIYIPKNATANPDAQGGTGTYQTRGCIFCAKKVLKSAFAVEEHLGSKPHKRAKQRLENRLLSLEDLDTDDPRVLVAEIDAELERKKQVAAVEELVGRVDKDGNPLPSKLEKLKAKKEKNDKLKLKHQNQKAKRAAIHQAKLASGAIKPLPKDLKQQNKLPGSSTTTISKLSKEVSAINPELVANLKGNRKQRRKLLLEELELKKMVDKGLTEEEIKRREEGKKQREASKIAKKEKKARKRELKIEKSKARYFEQEA